MTSHFLLLTVPFFCYPEILSFLRNKGFHMVNLFPHLPFMLQSSNVASDSVSILAKATSCSTTLITAVNSFLHFLYTVSKTNTCFFPSQPKVFFFFSGYTLESFTSSFCHYLYVPARLRNEWTICCFAVIIALLINRVRQCLTF